MPVLHVDDVEASADWFEKALGFELAGVWRDEDAPPRFAIVRLDDITLGLSRSAGEAGRGEGWAAYLFLEDIDAFADEILGRGVAVERGPEDTFYHCRELEVVEPSGNRICFAQDLKPGPDGPGL